MRSSFVASVKVIRPQEHANRFTHTHTFTSTSAPTPSFLYRFTGSTLNVFNYHPQSYTYSLCTSFRLSVINSHYSIVFIHQLNLNEICCSSLVSPLSLSLLLENTFANRNEKLFRYREHNPSIYLHLFYFHPTQKCIASDAKHFANIGYKLKEIKSRALFLCVVLHDSKRS